MSEAEPINGERLADIRSALRRSGLPPAWHNTVVDLLDECERLRASLSSRPAPDARAEAAIVSSERTT